MAIGPDDPLYPVRTARAASRSVYQSAVDVVLTGVVTLLPVVVTVYSSTRRSASSSRCSTRS